MLFCSFFLGGGEINNDEERKTLMNPRCRAGNKGEGLFDREVVFRLFLVLQRTLFPRRLGEHNKTLCSSVTCWVCFSCHLICNCKKDREQKEGIHKEITPRTSLQEMSCSISRATNLV